MVQWTEAQQSAIEAPKPGTLESQTLLVAAAAGSGKTAVLVERILQRLLDTERPLRINELLVLTFTKAAAAEMKTRIGLKLSETYETTKNPYLEEQLNLLPSAQISTLHSFCQWVIRNYFYELDMDPDYKIASEGEMKLMQSEILDALIHQAYADNLYHMANLTEYVSKTGSEDALKSIILRLYHFAQAMENPMDWLASLKKEIFVEGGTSFEETPWGSFFWELRSERLRIISAQIKGLHALLTKPYGPAPWTPIYEYIRDLSIDMFNAKKWDAFTTVANNLGTFPRMNSLNKSIEAGDIDGVYADEFKSRANSCKSLLRSFSETAYRLTSEEWIAQLGSQSHIIEGLVDATIAFAENFAKRKAEEGYLDFNDLEHVCLRLLTEGFDEEGHRIPSRVALELQDTFKEIMLDEYQDTNGVQEAIVNLVSHKDNRFYVGDVKQSIYSFRMADPSLFLAKYDTYGQDVNNLERRIDLSRNFRSHANILEATNFLFSQIMTRESAELDYGAAEALYPGRTIDNPPKAYIGGPVQITIITKPKQGNKTNTALEGMENSSTTLYEGMAEDVSKESDPTIAAFAEATMDFETAELEAHFIAKEIRELISSERLVQDKDGSFRPIRYSDIVILLRSIKNKGQAMVDVLRMHNIPAYVADNSGYFSSLEIKLIMELLRIIDNPRQDLALASVLRSPFVGIDDNCLAALRLYEGETLWDAMQAALAEPAQIRLWMDEHTFAAFENFHLRLDQWRTYSRRHSVSELLWQIYEDTDYIGYVSAMQNGIVRRANVLALYDRAKEYERGEFKGLYRFLLFLQNLQDLGEDLSIAKTVGEGDDVIRILSIHKSKGLEFPVVFVSNANKQFNMKDLSNRVLLHKEAGIGLNGYYPELRVTYPSISHLYVKEKLRLSMLAEEERILYVAMTRAKDKLYIVGTVNDVEAFCEKTREAHSWTETQLPKHIITGASSYLQWIWLALTRHVEAGLIQKYMDSEIGKVDLPYGHSHWHIVHEVATPDIIDACKEFVPTSCEEALAYHEEVAEEEGLPKALREQLIDRLHYVYPYEESVHTPAKTSVTELKRRAIALGDAEMESASLIPPVDGGQSEGALEEERLSQEIGTVQELGSTQEDKGLFAMTPYWVKREEDLASGATYGTLLHKAMQFLPVPHKAYTRKALQYELYALRDRHVFTEAECQTLLRSWQKFSAFYNSSLGQWLAKSKKVKREFSFSLLMEGNTYYKDLESGEKVFLQGVIDLLFYDEEAQGWILVDYKTDRIDKAEDLVARYEVQLKLYKDAVEQLMEEPVVKTYIYSFKLEEAIPLFG